MATAPSNGTGKSLETWLWDAACSIRGAKEAAKYKDYILPLVFTKRLCDVYDDEINRIAKEVGSRAKAFALVVRDKQPRPRASVGEHGRARTASLHRQTAARAVLGHATGDPPGVFRCLFAWPACLKFASAGRLNVPRIAARPHTVQERLGDDVTIAGGGGFTGR